jgi:2-amino-4-hydroxy-6-hydroxymethyldihydropteridine diphosphokinase
MNSDRARRAAAAGGTPALRMTPVVIALGSNLGNRQYNLRWAIDQLRRVVRLVRVSSIHETKPVDAPLGSPLFMNMVVVGLAAQPPHELMRELLAIEKRLGRVRRGRNAPRVIDLDLIFYSAQVLRTRDLVIPHPRYRHRDFVLGPLRELSLPWHDPQTNLPLEAL